MKNYFAFKQNIAGDCGVLRYESNPPPVQDILRLYLASEADALIAELRDIVRQAEKDVLSSAGICIACGEIDEGDGEPEHAKDCWVPRSRELLRVL